MTLQKFAATLKKINPKLRLKVRGNGDIIGLFGGLNGANYICRLTKGELTTDGYRHILHDSNNLSETRVGPIKKRGRKTVINLLRNYRWLTHHKQRSALMWGTPL